MDIFFRFWQQGYIAGAFFMLLQAIEHLLFIFFSWLVPESVSVIRHFINYLCVKSVIGLISGTTVNKCGSSMSSAWLHCNFRKLK